MGTYTLTFGDCAENHVGMERIGEMRDKGLSVNKIKKIKKYFDEKEKETEFYNLNKLLEDNEHVEDAEHACILVVRNGVSLISKRKKLLEEQGNLEYDTKALMRGRVVNKVARHNICFSDYSQEANFEDGEGTIVNFEDVPELSRCKEFFEQITGIGNLSCEGNYYYDVHNTYIGFHGDTERRIVIAIRLGENFPLRFRWYVNGSEIGEKLKIILRSGDIYFMSEKAVGTDWKTRRIPTLRHAAGFNIPKKKNKNAKTCKAEKANGDPCTFKRKEGSKYCGVHSR